MKLEAHYPSYILAIAGLIGVIKFQKLNLFARLAFLVVFVNLVTDLFGAYLTSKGIGNHWLYSISTTVEISLSIIIYARWNPKTLPAKWLYFLLTFVLLIFIVNFLFIQRQHTMNTYSYIPGALIICILSYLMLRKMVITDTITINNIMVWFCAANFVYYSATIPLISALIWLLTIEKELPKVFFTVIQVFYSIWGILIGIGFLCSTKKDI